MERIPPLNVESRHGFTTAHRDHEPKASASRCSLHALSDWEIRDANPKGIPSLSPGLRGTSYPGRTTSEGEFNPNGVVACRVDMRCNPVGVGRFPIGPPRVARPSQPWADGHNPVGIENACKVQQLAGAVGRWCDSKAGASSSHSKRFARFGCGSAARRTSRPNSASVEQDCL